MKSFVAYQLKNYIRSFLFIPPVALYMAWVGILYAYSTMSILSSYANSAVALFVIMTWITMNIFRLEEEAEKNILIVHLRQKESFLYGKWFTSLAMMIPLILFAHFYPIVTGSFIGKLTGVDIILSFYCHIGLGIFGIITGSFFAGTKFTKSKYVWLLTALTVTMSLAHSQLETILPKGIAWVLWVLPPLRFIYGPLKGTSTETLPAGFLGSFSLALFYCIMAGLVIRLMFKRNEKI